MSDSVPADVPLGEQEEEPARGTPATGDLDEQGEDLDERGLTPEASPANPVSEDAGMT